MAQHYVKVNHDNVTILSRVYATGARVMVDEVEYQSLVGARRFQDGTLTYDGLVPVSETSVVSMVDSAVAQMSSLSTLVASVRQTADATAQQTSQQALEIEDVRTRYSSIQQLATAYENALADSLEDRANLQEENDEQEAAIEALSLQVMAMMSQVAEIELTPGPAGKDGAPGAPSTIPGPKGDTGAQGPQGLPGSPNLVIGITAVPALLLGAAVPIVVTFPKAMSSLNYQFGCSITSGLTTVQVTEIPSARTLTSMTFTVKALVGLGAGSLLVWAYP